MKYRLSLVLLLAVAACRTGAPPQFVRSANEAGTWRSIDVDKDLQQDKARTWSILVDALSTKYDLEVLDKESGYLRTSWKFVSIDGRARSETYRSRVVAKYNQGWSVLQVKSEAQWFNDGQWWDGFDSALLKDTYGDLQGRLGRTRQ
jgi:hypothetical protein